MTKNELAVIQKGLSVESKNTDIVQAVDHYNTMVEFVQKVMRKDIDYGVIPGSTKPTLLKPGAEKLTMLFKMGSEISLMEKVEDWQAGFFYFRYKCQVIKDGITLSECEGSTNSKEKKYRYRYAFENELSDDEISKAKRVERFSKKTNKKYFVYQIENTEPFDLVNTLQKMAQKRAFVGAVLIAANASEFFTQDIEDLSVVDGEIIEAEIDEGMPVPEKPKPARPYNLAMLKEGVNKKAVVHAGSTASKEQRGLMVGVFELCFAGDEAEKKRKILSKYITGQESSKDMPDEYVLALLDWLAPVKDSGGSYTPSKMSEVEANAAIKELVKQAA